MKRIFGLAVLLAATGCTHAQLRFNTVNQAKTVADVHTQQVLDNLAKFVHNPNALPHFSYPNQGAASVTDALSGGNQFGFNPSRLTGWGFNTGGSRTNGESYTMTPVNDPRKLELMKCAYQRAIAACCRYGASMDCPDCERRLNSFYTGSTTLNKTAAQTPDGKSVYRIKRSVEFIGYLPEGSSVVLPFKLDHAFNYEVYADRDGNNAVVYRFLASNDQLASTIPVGSLMFKDRKFRAEEKAILKQIAPAPAAAPDVESIPVPPAPQSPAPQAASDPQGVQGPGHQPPATDTERAMAGRVDKDDEGKGIKVPLAPSDLQAVYIPDNLSVRTQRSGRVTAACLGGTCWFEVGSRVDSHKWSKCCLVGSYCGTYVKVPECHRDELTKLTLTILDIATNQAAGTPTMEVFAFIDSSGKRAAKFEEAAFVARATVARGGNPSSLIAGDSTTFIPTKSQAELKDLSARARDMFIAHFDLKTLPNRLTGIDRPAGPIRFIDSEYRERSLPSENGDAIVRLAHHVLRNSAKFDLQTVTDARAFLSAEADFQVPAVAPGITVESQQFRTQDLNGAAILQLQQRLNALTVPTP